MYQALHHILLLQPEQKLGNEKRIPFEVAVDPFYSDENMARLRKSISQLQMGLVQL